MNDGDFPMLLQIPTDEMTVRKLRCGDQVLLRGVIYTARDAVHKYFHEQGENLHEPTLAGGVFYHCGPVIIPDASGKWEVVAAGPTTSIREEPYMASLIRRLGLRAVIGKGGMGQKTRQACRECGCVYLHAVGGCAQVLADSIRGVKDVRFLDRFGAPEAMWALEVENFPATVTIDALGDSLHDRVKKSSGEKLQELLRSEI